MMQNIFLHHDALTCAMWQAQQLYTAAILTATLQHSTLCRDALSLTLRHGTLPATGRTLHREAKSLLQRKGTNCRDAREIHGAKKERESVTVQSQRRSVVVQSHCCNANERASQRDAKRAATQQKDCCVAALFVFASHRNPLTCYAAGGFALQNKKRIVMQKS